MLGHVWAKCSIWNSLCGQVRLRFRVMPKPKENDHIHRITYLRRLCSSADDMHTETVRLVNELATSPRVAKSAAIRIKRLEAIARMERTRGKP